MPERDPLRNNVRDPLRNNDLILPVRVGVCAAERFAYLADLREPLPERFFGTHRLAPRCLRTVPYLGFALLELKPRDGGGKLRRKGFDLPDKPERARKGGIPLPLRTAVGSRLLPVNAPHIPQSVAPSHAPPLCSGGKGAHAPSRALTDPKERLGIVPRKPCSEYTVGAQKIRVEAALGKSPVLLPVETVERGGTLRRPIDKPRAVRVPLEHLRHERIMPELRKHLDLRMLTVPAQVLHERHVERPHAVVSVECAVFEKRPVNAPDFPRSPYRVIVVLFCVVSVVPEERIVPHLHPLPSRPAVPPLNRRPRCEAVGEILRPLRRRIDHIAVSFNHGEASNPYLIMIDRNEYRLELRLITPRARVSRVSHLRESAAQRAPRLGQMLRRRKRTVFRTFRAEKHRRPALENSVTRRAGVLSHPARDVFEK